MTDAAAPGAPVRSASPRRGQLALLLQETLTAAVRLRPDRPIGADANAFRSHVSQALSTAQQDASRAGYSDDDVRAAVAAVAAFVDDRVTASRQPFAGQWKPMSGEFSQSAAGGVLEGELRAALPREDSADLADLLEVFALCVALGSRVGDSSGETVTKRLLERIDRIRGGNSDDAMWNPSAHPVAGGSAARKSPLMLLAVGIFALALVLFGGFWFSLRSSVAAVGAQKATATTSR